MASKKNTARTRSTFQVDQKSNPVKEASRKGKVQAIEHPVQDDFTQGSELITLDEATLNAYKELACNLLKQYLKNVSLDTKFNCPAPPSNIKALKTIFSPIELKQRKEIGFALEDLAWNMGFQLPVLAAFTGALKIHDERDNTNNEVVLDECKRGLIAFISEINRCRSMGLSDEKTNKALKTHEDWYLNMYQENENIDLLDEATQQLTKSGLISKADLKNFREWETKCLFFVTNKKNKSPQKSRYPWRERFDQNKNSLDVTATETLRHDEQHPMEREIMDEDKTLDVDFANATDPIALGHISRNARLNAGLSQGKLEKTSNISISTISRIETGKGTTPNLETLKDIAKATNTDLQIRFTPKSK